MPPGFAKCGSVNSRFCKCGQLAGSGEPFGISSVSLGRIYAVISNSAEESKRGLIRSWTTPLVLLSHCFPTSITRTLDAFRGTRS